MWYRLLSLAGLVVAAAACVAGADHEIEARWARGELPPEALIEDSTPTLADEGIDLRELRCEVTAGHLHYELELVNPYEDTFDAWAFTGLDGGTQGHLWGLYQFPLPPGLVAVTFPDPFEEGEHADVLSTARDEVGAELEQCSVVLLGVSDEFDAAFTHPVITTDLASSP